MNRKLRTLLCFSMSLSLILGLMLNVNAAELNTNLLLNSGGEQVNNGGQLISNGWSGDNRGYSNQSVNDFSTLIQIEKQYHGNDITSVLSVVPYSESYYMGFATAGTGSVGEGTYNCYQEIDISGNAADIDSDAMVFNLNGMICATGGNIATISVEQLDASKNVVSTPAYEESVSADTWTGATLTGAVAPNVRYLKVIITGTHSACGVAAFDDLSLTISTNSSATPVISPVSDQTIVSGETLGSIRFPVSDDDTNFSNLSISVESSNTSVIPNSNISASLSDGYGEISLTAASGQAGQSTITVSVTDGTKTAVMHFCVTVNEDVQMDTNLIVNGEGSSLSGWTDPNSRFYVDNGKFTYNYSMPYYMYQTINVSKFSEMIDAGFLTFTASCDLIGGEKNAIFMNSYGGEILSTASGSGVIPSGTRTIRMEVGGTSGCKISNVNFKINSTGLPRITTICDQTVKSSTGDIPFTIGYAENSVNLTATSSNISLVPDSQMSFGGSGYQRTICVTPTDGAAGSSMITISADGVVVGSFVVNKTVSVESLTVSAEGNATSVLYGETLQMTAGVSPINATNNSVDWIVENGTGSATINDAGLLTPTGIGTVTVRATANDGSGVSGTCEITINGILVSDVAISSEKTSIYKDEALQMTAVVTPANASEKSVTWIVENGTGSATISDAGFLTATGVGTVTVKATANDGSGKFGTSLITIQAIPVSNIAVSSENNLTSLFNKETLQMTAIVTPESAQEKSVTWSVVEGGTGNATISDTGLLTATGAGTVTVKATANDGSGVCGTHIITINPEPVRVTQQPEGLTLTYGYTNSPTLSVTAQTQPVDSGKVVTYQWYKDNVAIDNAINADYTISSDLDAGNYTYYCAATCDGYTVNSDSVTVTVNELSGSIVNKNYETLYNYNSNPIAIPEKSNFFTNSDGAMTFTWYEGDSTQDSDKMNEAPVNAGTYTLKADLGETANVAFASITLRVNISKVEQAPLNIADVTGEKYGNGDFTLTTTGGSGTGEVSYAVPDASGMTYGQKLSTSTLTGGSTEYGDFAWEDSDVIPGVNGGANTSTVIFTPSADTLKNYEPIEDQYKRNTVDFSVSKATSAVNVSATVSGSEGTRHAVLTATVSRVGSGDMPTGSIKFVDSTSGSDVGISGAEAVTINSDTATYTWTGLGQQLYKVKAIYGGDNNYETALSGELSFDSSKLSQRNFTISDIGIKTYGDENFDLTTIGGDGQGIVSFESSDPSIISIVGSTATIHKAGTVNITAKKAQDLDYNEAEHTAVVTVDKKAITVKADYKKVVKGRALPTFTYAATGLVNQDSFTVAPEILSTAIDTNTVGEYTITISGGTLKNAENYIVNYVNGKLSIVNRSSSNSGSSSGNGGTNSANEASTLSAGKDGNLAKSLVDKLVKEEVKEFSINCETSTINLDIETLKTIQKQVNYDVIVSAKKVDNAILSVEAKEVVGNRPVFEFTITGTNGTKVTNFGKGKISVFIPYILGENEKAENVVVYYIDNDGKVHEVPNSVYDERRQMVIFETDHFSKFAVGYKEEGTTSVKTTVFKDIEGHWAKDAITFVTTRGIFDGTAQNKFSPNMPMTRGMFVTVLGRLAKADVSNYKESYFEDVSSNAYYMPYIEWASKNHIVSGISAMNFAPEQAITREQMAVIMANYAKATGFELPQLQAENSFADNDKISNYAKNAVKQMQMAGLLSGKIDNQFDSKGTATRAEVSAVIKRFVEISEKK